MKKDKQFANEIIAGLSKTKNYYCQEIVYYAIKHYEPAYHSFFENLFIDAQYHDNCKQLSYSKLVGEINDFK